MTAADPETARLSSDLRTVFIHTPMSAMAMPEFESFWRHFDVRYHAAHPGLRHMNNVMWELPHWMHWLAGILAAHGYRNFGVADFYTHYAPALEGMDETEVAAQLRAAEADVYLFSPMVPNLHFAVQIAAVAKRIYPNCRTIFGGCVATPMHAVLAADPNIDFVIRDRAENALPDLMRAIAGDLPFDAVGHLTMKYNGNDPTRVVASKKIYPWMPVSEIPFPVVELFPPSTGGDLRYIRQVYALGCPFKCPFCTIQTIGRKADYFPIGRVSDEIDAYRTQFGHHHNIYFGDETFTIHRQNVLRICEMLRARGDVHWDCQTRLNCLNDDAMLAAMQEAGCTWIEIGIETINQDSQNLFKQRIKLKEMETTLRRVQDAGLNVCAFLVNGFPNQTLDDMRRSIDYSCSLFDRGLLDATYFNGLVPYPGTDLFDRPEAYGMRIRHRDLRHYHEDGPPVFDSLHASAEDVFEVFRRGTIELAEAMGRSSAKAPRPPDDELRGYGTFWNGSVP